jgi:exonuclease SbcC
MKIEIVQLENIRSHAKSTVPFARGFNCLVGGLGCGKSTILYAIDFALFGDPIGRSYEYLLRDGENTGSVTLQFVQNGQSYRITRALKRKGKNIGQDFEELKLFEDDKLISSAKSEAVAEQVKAITGLDKDIYREIVWVRQEHLKELLDTTPRERQKRLDELFGLSDYETAWGSIAIYQRDYEAEKRTYEKDPDIVGMEKLDTEYNKTAEECSLIELEIEDTAKRFGTAKKTLEEADLKLKRLEEVKDQSEELRRKEARLHANLTNTENALTALKDKIETKKKTVITLKQRLSTLEKQTADSVTELEEMGFSKDQTLETMRKCLSGFDDKISSLKGEQESNQRGIREDQKRTTSLSTENRCPLCLQTLTEEYKNGLIQRIQTENEERRKTTNILQQEIEELQKTKKKADSGISNLQTLTPRMEELRNRINEEAAALGELSIELEERQRQEHEQLLQLEAVRIEISSFDTSQLETARTQREQAFKQYYLLESDLRTKENRKRDLTKRLDNMKDRIDNTQQKIERMEKIAKAVGIINGIRDAYRSIQPKLRSEFVKVLRNFAQQILDNITGEAGPFLNIVIDESYTPFIKSDSDVEREVSNLSGGERTLLAFAYRLALGQLIMQSKTGHGLSMLLLDEPTESLGREDGSIDRLAEAISRFKAIEQIIAVTHNEAFAEKAEHVIRLEKEAGISKVSIER